MVVKWRRQYRHGLRAHRRSLRSRCCTAGPARGARHADEVEGGARGRRIHPPRGPDRIFTSTVARRGGVRAHDVRQPGSGRRRAPVPTGELRMPPPAADGDREVVDQTLPEGLARRASGVVGALGGTSWAAVFAGSTPESVRSGRRPRRAKRAHRSLPRDGTGGRAGADDGAPAWRFQRQPEAAPARTFHRSCGRSTRWSRSTNNSTTSPGRRAPRPAGVAVRSAAGFAEVNHG